MPVLHCAPLRFAIIRVSGTQPVYSIITSVVKNDMLNDARVVDVMNPSRRRSSRLSSNGVTCKLL